MGKRGTNKTPIHEAAEMAKEKIAKAKEVKVVVNRKGQTFLTVDISQIAEELYLQSVKTKED